MMTISEGSMPGAGEAMGTRVAARGRRRRGPADGRSEMADGRSEMADGRSEMADGRSEMADGRLEMADGRLEMADGRSEMADGRSEMADGGTAGTAVAGQDAGRCVDSQPLAADRAKEVWQGASHLGVGDARAGGVGEVKEVDAGAMVAVEEVVVELHVRQGRPLREVARALGVDAAGMQVLWRRTLAHLAQLAPKEEVDFTAVREQICAALWETVECTFPKAPLPAAPAGKAPELRVGTDGQMELPLRFSLPPAPVLAAEPPSAPMLTVRLRALDQLAKLYDVGLARGASGADAEPDERPYATPPEIAEAVRLRLLEMHGRAGDGSRV